MRLPDQRSPLLAPPLFTPLGAFPVAAPSAASPADAAGARGVAIRHADLDLANPADVIILEQRVSAAAEAVCRRPGYSNEAVLGFRTCVSDTVARAQPLIRAAITRQNPNMARSGSEIAPGAR